MSANGLNMPAFASIEQNTEGGAQDERRARPGASRSQGGLRDIDCRACEHLVYNGELRVSCTRAGEMLDGFRGGNGGRDAP